MDMYWQTIDFHCLFFFHPVIHIYRAFCSWPVLHTWDYLQWVKLRYVVVVCWRLLFDVYTIWPNRAIYEILRPRIDLKLTWSSVLTMQQLILFVLLIPSPSTLCCTVLRLIEYVLVSAYREDAVFIGGCLQCSTSGHMLVFSWFLNFICMNLICDLCLWFSFIQ
jgi:hypothetical protein